MMFDLNEASTGYVYVIDFGDVIKVGFSTKPETRMKTLAKVFQKEIQRYIVIPSPHALDTEYLVKRRLRHYGIKEAGFVTETFSCSFSRCVRAVCDADDFITKSRIYAGFRKQYFLLQLKTDIVESLKRICEDGYSASRICEDAIEKELSSRCWHYRGDQKEESVSFDPIVLKALRARVDEGSSPSISDALMVAAKSYYMIG